MALSDEVLARFSSQYMISLTNPQSSAATTVDTTRLNYASTDTQALFQIHCGTNYDNTNSIHVLACVPVVIDLLRIYSGQVSREQVQDSIVGGLQAAAKILGRDRIAAYTDSLLDPTDDTSGDLPKSDRQNFKGFLTNSPGQPTTQD